MTDIKISLAIINRNDVAGARLVIPAIDRNLFFEIFAVDGNSSDGSVDFFNQQNIQTHIIKEGGRGGAMHYAANIAKGDFIIYLSSDGEEDVADLEKFIEKFQQGADMVIASRTMNGAHHKAKEKLGYYHRLLFLKLITALINIFFCGNLTDCWNGYRGFNLKKLRSVEIDAKDFLIEAQQSIRFLKKKFIISEFPTYEKQRVAGNSSNPIFRSGWLHLVMIFREKFFLS